MTIGKRHQRFLALQRWVSWLCFFWFGPLFWVLLRGVGGYRLRASREARAKVRAALALANGRPLLICANHLTMIDSMLLTAFMFPISKFLVQFRNFPWNVPGYQNFSKNLALRAMCYLGKCVYIERQGSTASKELAWAKIKYLLGEGELVCIFPEGGRSRTGCVVAEDAVYGVGQLVMDVPDCVVLACYLRGAEQETYSFFPKRGDQFHLDLKLLEIKTEAQGRRGARDLTLKIMAALVAMETRYFCEA